MFRMIMVAALLAGGMIPAAAQGKIKAPAAIATAGELVVCTDLTSAPAIFLKPGSTDPVGYEAEMTAAIARLLGVKPVYRNIQFKGIIAALLAGKCDVIIASIGDTTPREKSLDFVNYANVGTSIVVPPGNPNKIKDLQDLSGHSVSVDLGTNPQLALDFTNKELVKAGKPAINIVTFSDATATAAAMATGKVDAYYIDTPPAAYQKTQQPQLFDLVSPQIFLDMIGQVNGLTAIAIRKDEGDLKTSLTEAIKELYASGDMRKIFAGWNVESILLPEAFMSKCMVDCATLKVE